MKPPPFSFGFELVTRYTGTHCGTPVGAEVSVELLEDWRRPRVLCCAKCGEIFPASEAALYMRSTNSEDRLIKKILLSSII